MATLTKHQDYYNKCVDARLRKEFDWFVRNHRGVVPINPELKTEDGVSKFIDHAYSCGYMLGMKPFLKNDNLDLRVKNIGWQFDQTAKITWPDQETLKRNKRLGQHGCNPPTIVDTSAMIPGFGIKLNLTGWKIFCGRKMTYAILQSLLDEGKTIEEIFDMPRKGKRRVLVYQGEELSTNEALDKAHVSRRWFNRKVQWRAKQLGITTEEVSDEDRQKIFDELIEKVAETEQTGLLMSSKRCFIRLLDDDLEIVLQNARMEGVKPVKWLHDILQSYSFK